MKHASAPYGGMPVAGPPMFPGSERQVEFVGPPGVGKSAIYNAVIMRLGRQRNYRTVNEGRRLAAMANLHRMSLIRRMSYRSAFKLPRIGDIYALRLAANSSNQTFRDILHSQEAFLDCCIELARSGFGDAFARFARLALLQEHLRDLHLWNCLPGTVQILQQDALVQKGWACARQLRETYFSSVPRPGAVVIVEADPDVVVERLRGRPRVINAHLGLDQSELYAATVTATEAFQLAGEVLRGRGVSVFKVSGQANISEAAGQVIEFLQNRYLQQEER